MQEGEVVLRRAAGELELVGIVLVREEGAEIEESRRVTLPVESGGGAVVPPRLRDVPVGEDQPSRLNEEPRPVVLDGVDGALALRSQDGGHVVPGVVVRPFLVPQRPSAGVVEGVGPLDEAHAPAVLLDDLLPHRALGLQAGDALLRRPQLVAQGLDLARGGAGQLRAQVLLARAVVLDALLQRAALGVRAPALGVHALLQRAPLRVHLAHGLAQRRDLGLEAAVLAPGPAEQQGGQDPRRRHRAAEGPAAAGHRAQDQGVRDRSREGRLDGNGQQRLVRARPRERRQPIPLEAQPGTVGSQGDDVAGPQDGLLHELPREERSLRGSAVEEYHRAVALEHDGVAGGDGGHLDVGVGVGADGGGKAGQPGRLARARTAHVGEADAVHVSEDVEARGRTERAPRERRAGATVRGRPTAPPPNARRSAVRPGPGRS